MREQAYEVSEQRRGLAASEKKLIALLAVLSLLIVATPALAGPPFVCHPFDIGTAKSLPYDSTNWLGVRTDYDITHVVADTEALLTSGTPTIVRMETLRRAALYASRERAVAEQLLNTVMARVRSPEQGGQPMAMALFDAGYLSEALSEIAQFGNHMPDLAHNGRQLVGLTQLGDGRALIQKSLALRPGDAAMEFALTLLLPSTDKDKASHLRIAQAGAKQDGLLAANLVKLQMQ